MCPSERATRAKAAPGINRHGVAAAGLCLATGHVSLLEQRRRDKSDFSFHQIICQTQA